MPGMILVTGGCRSGKSALAQRIAECYRTKVYVATCPVLDEEMAHRVAKHQAARTAAGWQTVEEPLNLSDVIHRADKADVILLDCLTLWINNLLFAAEQQGRVLEEEHMIRLCETALAAIRTAAPRIVVVTNETGLGIVPDNPLSRRFRDLAGRTNQMFAGAAETAIFMVSGQPLFLKGQLHPHERNAL